MKIAVVYNSPAGGVFQRRGPRAQEVYSQHNLERIVDALKENGHEVAAIDADRNLIEKLETFFSPLQEGEWPGLVFNIAFGLQGQLRYCHVPALLDMLGLPYLGSGPLGQALASDKAAAKAIFIHSGLPTPDFILAHDTDFAAPDFGYPHVVKPVAEGSSLGVCFVNNEKEMRQAVKDNLKRFRTPVMVERYVDGREINVSVIGNCPGTALAPVEVILGAEGPPIYTLEDKERTANRRFDLLCPASIPASIAAEAQQFTIKAFNVLGCRDWARVEMKLDEFCQLQLIELNTIPGLGAYSSLPASASHAGMVRLPMLVQRLVDVALERYGQRSEISKRDVS